MRSSPMSRAYTRVSRERPCPPEQEAPRQAVSRGRDPIGFI